MTQLDLFMWAASRPSNVIDAVPALIRRICRDDANRAPRPGQTAEIIPLEVRAA